MRCGFAGVMFIAVLCYASVGFGADYKIVEAFPQLQFNRPVDFQSDMSSRIFVVEQDGLIRVFENDATVASSDVFLDIRDRVSTAGNEMGLLGLALHPDYQETGEFFVYYTAGDGRERVGRVSRFSTRDRLATEEVVLEVVQPWSNHNGGALAFGPDGYLYVGLGDGGGAGDPAGNGQNRETLLGSILRLDIETRPYAIPPDNPFAGKVDGARGEIWAFGLRNPWRMSFDPASEWLWTADVGQNTWEEVDIVEKGRNYGWDCREGYLEYEPAAQRSSLCQGSEAFAPPVWVYGRDLGRSVTGGYVYRGANDPDLVGWYVYADYVSGRIWALYYDETRARNRLLVDTDLLISSFGTDAAGEIYICDHNPAGGETNIYRLQRK